MTRVIKLLRELIKNKLMMDERIIKNLKKKLNVKNVKIDII